MISKDVTKEKEIFHNKGYCLVKNAVSTDLCRFIYGYLNILKNLQEHHNELNSGDDQIPDAKFILTKDPCLESVFFPILPIMQKVTGWDLLPTYCYARIYKKDNELHRHTDRPSCEISATLKIHETDENSYTWPIYMANEKITMGLGDLVIYRGCDVPHWREKCEGDEKYELGQVFIHSVRENGKYKEFRYDNSPLREKILSKCLN